MELFYLFHGGVPYVHSEGTFLTVLFLGLILGLKHAIEPDHIIAVSTLAHKNTSKKKALMAGTLWGVGHTATIALALLLVTIFKMEISESLETLLEAFVGVMIIVLGVQSLRVIYQNLEYKYTNARPAFIGFIHGLAGSGAMVVFVGATTSSYFEMAFYLAVFGLGTVASMILFTLGISLSFIVSTSNKFKENLGKSLACISILFGFYYIAAIFLI